MGGTLWVDVHEAIAFLTLKRPDKRNAVSDALLAEIDGFFAHRPIGLVSLPKVLETVTQIAGNAPPSNHMLIQGMARIHDMGR